ncbi:hypothetical protein TNCV_1445851 [Trichonephila clavipes]|nr:hypothetical protein TNCV_1445851 [Trichonephila clavipes]
MLFVREEQHVSSLRCLQADSSAWLGSAILLRHLEMHSEFPTRMCRIQWFGCISLGFGAMSDDRPRTIWTCQSA